MQNRNKNKFYSLSVICLMILCITFIQGCTTGIINASYDGNTDRVKELINEGIDVNTDFSGVKPLHNAAMNGHIAIVKLLIENGANVNAVTNQGVTPLHNAAAIGHVNIVKLLIANGAKVNIKTNSKGLTPLDNAIINGHDDVAKLLINKGAKRNNVVVEKSWNARKFCTSVGKLKKGMSVSEIKNLLGEEVLAYFGAASCRLAKKGSLTYKNKLSNGVIYTIGFDKDCRLVSWDFGCK